MADAQRSLIEVEVVYALPRTQTVITLRVPAGTSVGEAIARSGIAATHPEVDWNSVAVGIFGQPASAAAALADHDRIEIFRPLIADPKQARRRRARRSDRR